MSSFPTRDEVAHWMRVARAFWPWERAFWLGLLHDTVEDGYLPERLLRWWPALDAMTHRDGEPYWTYIRRLSRDPLARRVKFIDARDNFFNRPNPRMKYWHVMQYLSGNEPPEVRP